MLTTGSMVLAAGWLAGCDGGSDKADDAAANDAIVAKLPTYPDARVHDKSVNPYFPEDGGGTEPLGHTTNVSYEVPPGTDPVAVRRDLGADACFGRRSGDASLPVAARAAENGA